jgi:hypothetical protein
VSTREDGRWRARGDVIDLRKVGFVPLLSDIQPAGIIHQMSIELVVDPARGRIDSVAVDQPFVAIEPNPLWGGECCRDPAPRLQQLAGEKLDGAFARALSGAFGGPRGCSHLLTLFQLMNTGLQRAIRLETGLPADVAPRAVEDWLFRRSVFVEGFEAEDESVEMAVQLADFHSRPGPAPAMSIERLAGQWEVRAFARVAGPTRALSDLVLATRERSNATLAEARWRDRSDRLAPLAGGSVAGGLARRLFDTFAQPEDQLMLDATLQLAPGYIQVVAAVVERWLQQRRAEGARGTGPPDAAIGGMADSCYMWRSDGRMLQIRNAAIPGGDRPAER